MKSRSTSGGLVYSTDSGRMCPVCRQPTANCICNAVKPKPSSDGVVRVSRETKGRAGKVVKYPSERRDADSLQMWVKTLAGTA